MARIIKIAGSSAKPKKTKKTKITSATIRENRGKDLSPSWVDSEKLGANEFLQHYHAAMQYYNLQLSAKDAKLAVIQWMETNGIDNDQIISYKKTADWRTSNTMAGIASCLLKGMPVHRVDFNNGSDSKEWLINRIQNIIIADIADIVPDESDKKPIAPVINIQERIREATLRMTDEIEDAIEVWIATPDNFDPKQIKVLNLLKGKEAKPVHARIIKEYYAVGLAELMCVIDGGDEELNEGYSHRNKKQLTNILTFYKEIDSACTMLMEEAKVTRKPRAKKIVPKDKLVEKLKYLKTFEPLKLVSVNPTDIIGATELYCYDVKSRKLYKYISDELTGPIGIKGTTLVGYDEHKSIGKTLRKPLEQLDTFKKSGKVALRTFMDGIPTVDIKATGRINENQILLKVS